MNIVYAHQAFPTECRKSIFLAGPTPRDRHTPSFRPNAIRILEQLGFDGTVFVPEAADGIWRNKYLEQCTWETEALNRADDIVFWVPRDLKVMPAFTTNVEFGLWLETGKLTYGAPEGAPKTKYFRYHADRTKQDVFTTLEATLAESVRKLGDGSLRVGGECQVPLHAWQSTQFQQWYAFQKAAGNRLDGARLVWSIRTVKNRSRLYLLALHVNIYIAAEKRNKKNEVVLMRPDIASVLLYRRAPKLEDTLVVLVKEFRSTVANAKGFVYELPSGSSPDPELKDLIVASEEVHEETGLSVQPSRFKRHGMRQLAATFSSHRSSLSSAEVAEHEIEFLKGQQGIAHGVFQEGDDNASERTFVEVVRFGDLFGDEGLPIDWSTAGMIYHVLSSL